MWTREIQLLRRPVGVPTPDLFGLVDVELPDPGPGQVLVENLALSVDPYMRPKMDDVPSYTPPYELNASMEGRAAGLVIASADDALPVGTEVVHRAGWREHAVLDTAEVSTVPDLGVPLNHHLGVLGTTGFTAWVGLSVIAPFVAGQRLFVSAAAGAVGSVAGQIATLRGAAQVVGSAGSGEKVAWLLDELGFDGAINYRAAPIGRALAEAMPDGCDVYFDNVGGDHLCAALDAMNDFGRIVMCGSISAYNAADPTPLPNNLFQATRKRLTLQGFILSDHLERREEFLAEVGPWVRDGLLRSRETVFDGLEAMPAAFLGMLAGENTGKTIVSLAPGSLE